MGLLADTTAVTDVARDVPATAWGVAIAAVAVGIAGRGWLPRGAAAGLCATGISTAGLLAVGPDWGRLEPAGLFRLAIVLTGLSVLWFAARLRIASKLARDATERGVYESVATQFSVLAGLSAGGTVLGMLWRTAGRDAEWGALLLGVLLALLVVVGVRSGRRAAPGLGAVGLAVLIARIVGDDWFTPRGHQVALVFLAVALAALAVVLLTTFAHWRWRARVAVVEPARLADPPPQRRRRYFGVVLLACVAGAGSCWTVTHPLTPVTFALAALAVAGVGHHWRSNTIGALSLALAGGCAATVPTAWWPGPAMGEMLGWALSGAWLLWLAKFWEQQLHDGNPWTTAGRLVPIARQVGGVIVGGGAAWAFGTVLSGGAVPLPTGFIGTVAALLFIGQALLLSRAAEVHHEPGATFLATTSLGLAVLHAQHVAAAWGLAWPIGVWPGVVAVLLALQVGRPQAQAGDRAIWTAWIDGVLPVVGLVTLVIEGAFHRDLAAAVLAVACLGVAIGWRALANRAHRVPMPSDASPG